MTPTTVRRATPADAGTVQQLLLELADHEGEGQHVHVDVARWRELLADPQVVVLLAEQGDEAVGYVSAVRQVNLWLGRDLLALDDLYVRECARGRGVGEQVMRALAAYAAADSLLIRWGLRSDNDGARRFYERLGATMRTKTIAAWRPHDYAALLSSST
ncbi:GNAT family N-acetyltransferase [Nocardioides sp. MAHUQ-72]|uniref:GNAT family N-acetyltransferase n=1 Tax=unclassified Nocardioides TaxID=2615069 RepID=UPI00361427B0